MTAHSATSAPAAQTGQTVTGRSPNDGRRVSRLTRALPPSVMLVVVLVSTILPTLRNPNFYYWDDTAGVAVGVWNRIGDQILSGHLPFLQLDMWRGGNFIAEAATGMWNPVMVGLMLLINPIDDLAVGITVAKIVFFLITAGGVYVLARSYTASRWMAALAGTVLPLAGWVLFMDGSSWINGVAITAFTPWAWWAIRRCYLLKGTPGSFVVAAVFGYLLASVGNPYGLLSLAAAFAAVAVEAIFHKRVKELWWLVALGVSLILMSIVVYLPFVLTSSVGFRADSHTYNDESLSPNLSDLMGLSAPTFKPYVTAFGLPYLTFPGAYLAWFILPLLPWLRWREVGSAWRSLAGVLAFGAFYLLMLLGPSQIWMFRWPARLFPFVYLAILIVFAVVISRGLHTSRPRARTILSVIAVAAGAWMAFSDMPGLWKWQALTTVLILGLGYVFLRFGRRLEIRGYAILAGGMVLFLGAQLAITPGNGNVANYNLPRSKAALVKQFSGSYSGMTVQVADFMSLGTKLNPDEAWQDLLAGNMYSVAGVESTTAYSGIGYSKLDNVLCESYNGGTCSAAWNVLWLPATGSPHILADLLRAQTVVVTRAAGVSLDTPPGWSLATRSGLANVYTRDEPVPYADGRVSGVGSAVTVSSDRMHGQTSETLEVTAGAGSEQQRTITFARLAWPGYSATVDGNNLPVTIGPDGLLSIVVPADLTDARVALSFTPPGLWAGVAGMLLGIVSLIALILVRESRRRAERHGHIHPKPAARRR